MEEVSEKIYWDTVNNAGEIKRKADHPVVQYFLQIKAMLIPSL